MVSKIKVEIEKVGKRIVKHTTRTKTMATTLIALLLGLKTVNGVIQASTNCRKR